VTVTLYDGSGNVLTTYQVSLTPGQLKQENRPFFNKAGRSDLDECYAKITVGSGSGVLAYASVVDNLTNDPATMLMKR
jgi:hypothetical protein